MCFDSVIGLDSAGLHLDQGSRPLLVDHKKQDHLLRPPRTVELFDRNKHLECRTYQSTSPSFLEWPVRQLQVIRINNQPAKARTNTNTQVHHYSYSSTTELLWSPTYSRKSTTISISNPDNIYPCEERAFRVRKTSS